jgi:hypothetical protein
MASSLGGGTVFASVAIRPTGCHSTRVGQLRHENMSLRSPAGVRVSNTDFHVKAGDSIA